MFSYSIYQIFLFILVIFKLESAYIILSFVIWYFYLFQYLYQHILVILILLYR